MGRLDDIWSRWIDVRGPTETSDGGDLLWPAAVRSRDRVRRSSDARFSEAETIVKQNLKRKTDTGRRANDLDELLEAVRAK